MLPSRATVPLLCWLAVCAATPTPAQQPYVPRPTARDSDEVLRQMAGDIRTLDSLRATVTATIAASGARVGFYFRDLKNGDSLAIDADERFHAASTMKVPVLIQAFRDVDERRIGLRDRITVTNEFRSLADSSPYQLDLADDSDSSLYRRIGQQVELRELLDLMITRSSNLATNNVIGRLGAERVQATLHELGADSVRVLRGVEDGVAFRAGINNTTTARGMGRVMASIAEAAAASAQSCGEMLRILLRQRFNTAIPAGLPRGTRVAHKTGEITAGHHDAAIVYYDNRPRFVLVILTRGLQEKTASAQLMAELAAVVNGYAVPESLVRRGFLDRVL